MAQPAYQPPSKASSPESNEAQNQAVRDLCPSCGLCCNGVLFATVRLSAEEAVPALEKQGAIWESSPAGKAFLQPCPAFRGSHCAIYSERPLKCREFHCGLLAAVAQGQMTLARAQAEIRETQRQVARIEAWLAQLGHPGSGQSLSRRCRQCLAAPHDNADETVEMRAELMLAVRALVQRLSSLYYNDSDKHTY